MTTAEFADIVFVTLDTLLLKYQDERAVDQDAALRASFQSTHQVALNQRLVTWDKAIPRLGEAIGILKAIAEGTDDG